jgi:hypothetical protein
MERILWVAVWKKKGGGWFGLSKERIGRKYLLFWFNYIFVKKNYI